jgi:hypothetical protein
MLDDLLLQLDRQGVLRRVEAKILAFDLESDPELTKLLQERLRGRLKQALSGNKGFNNIMIDIITSINGNILLR